MNVALLNDALLESIKYVSEQYDIIREVKLEGYYKDKDLNHIDYRALVDYLNTSKNYIYITVRVSYGKNSLLSVQVEEIIETPKPLEF
jgi:hypothetical protein